MSETQKWITSVTGAVFGQVLVLAFFYLLVVNTATPNQAQGSTAFQQKEVTVMLSQLVEQAPEELPPEEVKNEVIEEPPPEELPPEEEPLNNQRSFVDTDSNISRAEAPENARFESDRNTTASTEFLPDTSLPQVAGPTMRGEDQIKGLSLANQEYFDGDIKPDATPPPSSSSQAADPSQPAEETQPAEEIKDTAPSEMKEETELQTPADQLSEGEAEEAKPGEADTPPETVSDLLSQPDTETIGDEAQMAMTTKSFVDPSDAANAMKVPSNIGEKDQQAIATQKTEETGEPGAPEEKKEIKATPVVSGEAMDKIKQRKAAAAANVQRQLDESMFNPAFLAHQRRNNQNGDITDIGEGSVDAESTATGVYQKAVRQAIAKTWHQYRLDRSADVTWGVLKLRFNVTPSGRVKNLEIVKKEATELVTEFSLKAILDAKIPRMPDEVAKTLGPAGLQMNYNIVIY